MLSLALALASMPICPSGPRDNCVHDGDTLWWAGEKIRIANIDTPELRGQCQAETNLAYAARDRLAVLLGDGFTIHREGRDRYGRTLARLTVNGRDVGSMLVAEGYARRWDGARRGWC